MSQLVAIQIPKPSDEQAFERAANELFRCILRDPNMTLHGRRGQTQFGVDNSGIRDNIPDQVVGIQCKLKGDGKGLTEKEVREEVVKARKFKPLLSEYIIVTTEPDHALHTKLALTLSQEESKGRTKPLRVVIWGWDTLEREILQHPAAHKAFDPSHTPHGELMLDEIRQLKERLDEQPQVRAPSSKITGEIATGSEDGNPLHAHLDKQITQYAELLKSAPSAALELLAKLQDDLDETATPRLRYRAAANIAACHLELGDEIKSGEQLVSSYAIDPSHEKAAPNKALGLLLLGNKDEASKFASDKIKKQPKNGSLACYLIQARIGDESITDPLEGIPPELATDPEVEIALVKYASDVGPPGHWRELSVEAYGRHPDVPEVELNYAIALLDEAIETTQLEYGHVLNAEQLSNLEKVIDILTPRWEAIKDPAKHVRGDQLSAPLNLMTAYRLLHRAQDAKIVGLGAHQLFPDNDEVKSRLGAVYMVLGEHDEARSIVAEIPITPTSFMIRYTAAIETKDWPAIDDLYENHLEDCPASERSLIDAGYLIAKLSRSPRETVEAELEQSEATYENEPRALVALSQFCRFEGFSDQSLKFYGLAKAAFDEGSFGLADRMMFVNEAMNRDQTSDAASVLFGHVDLTRDSTELRMLAEALACEYPPRERGVEFFDSLPPALAGDGRYQVFDAVRRINSGKTEQAITLLKAAFRAFFDHSGSYPQELK